VIRYFSTYETVELTGIGYEILRSWVLRGYIKPDRTETVGAKNRVFKYWTSEGILKINKFRDLVSLGFSLSLARSIVYGARNELESEYFTIVLKPRAPERFIRFLNEDLGFSDPQVGELQRYFGEALVLGDARNRREP
jgi:DNA-binding transcriptional MerR regulator